MKEFIAFIGLFSLFMFFVGTPLALLMIGWDYAAKVAISSLFVLAFAVIVENIREW